MQDVSIWYIGRQSKERNICQKNKEFNVGNNLIIMLGIDINAELTNTMTTAMQEVSFKILTNEFRYLAHEVTDTIGKGKKFRSQIARKTTGYVCRTANKMRSK